MSVRRTALRSAPPPFRSRGLAAMSVVGRSPEAASLLPVAEGARPGRPHPGAWGWWAGRVAAGLLLGVGLAGLLPPAAPLFAAAAPTPVRSVAGQVPSFMPERPERGVCGQGNSIFRTYAVLESSTNTGKWVKVFLVKTGRFQ